jgi:hypothetical protein
MARASPLGTALRMVTRALREMITRRPVTMPVAGTTNRWTTGSDTGAGARLAPADP